MVLNRFYLLTLFLYFKQTVQIQIRRRVLRRLIQVCTVCKCLIPGFKITPFTRYWACADSQACLIFAVRICYNSFPHDTAHILRWVSISYWVLTLNVYSINANFPKTDWIQCLLLLLSAWCSTGQTWMSICQNCCLLRFWSKQNITLRHVQYALVFSFCKTTSQQLYLTVSKYSINNDVMLLNHARKKEVVSQ